MRQSWYLARWAECKFSQVGRPSSITKRDRLLPTSTRSLKFQEEDIAQRSLTPNISLVKRCEEFKFEKFD